MDALLSVDLGTTGCKAAVCTVTGRILGANTIEYPLIYPAPGFVEQDTNLWWALSLQAMRAALDVSEIPAETIRAVSVSTQGISFAPVDRSGLVLRNAINWLDTRAVEQAARIKARIGDTGLFQITGKLPSAAYVLPKLMWLREHEPRLVDRTAKFLMAHDFLIYRLCGAVVTDYSMAGGSALLDVRSLAWSEVLLSEFGVDRDQLPELAWSGTVAGKLTRQVAEEVGLVPGIPVVVGGQDQKCAALGAAIRPGVSTVSLGTASAITSLTEAPILDPHRRIPTFPFVMAGLWDLEGVISTAGAAMKWARDTLCAGRDYTALDDLAATSPPGAHGVRFYPHLAGATSPVWQSEARGAFLGLSLATDQADIVRSVLEGVAFQIRSNLDVMEELTRVERLVLFGGGARSRLWASIIAAVSGKPVQVAQVVDVANWGACILAGVGCGLIGRDEVGRSAGALEAEFCAAEAEVEQYDALYEGYLAVQQQVLPGV
ncbi:MAG: hypothetical protein GX620_03720 [Chloroflexi bacterium]|nr:hypothetical protein [Chloroflexota bacterium]